MSVLIRSMDRDSLPQALCSLADQGVDELEVLVLNASGRPHRPLPAGLPAGLSGRVRLIEPSAALDRAAAANRLLEEARSDALLFLDDDDELLPGHLGRLAAALRAAPAAAAAYGDVEYGRWQALEWQPEHRFAAPFDRWRLLFENYLPIHAVLFRRLPGLRFDEGFPVFEDWDFWLQLAERGPFEHVPGIGARYVAGATQGSGVFEAHSRNEAQRQALYAKWLARLSAAEAGALLAYVRELYQAHGQLQGELATATAGHAATRRVLQAREAELADLQQARTDLQAVLTAREQEIRNALAEQDSQRAVRAARETEIAALHSHAQALQAELNQLKALTPWQSFQAARRRAKPS
ncbi:glycosyltransferase [Inhella proteolytica]|uniref:Glycosyltransferase n=1 Tax=Inhella proteolytica TaxID=2795029 RepID=A0A931NHQ1_9BURK|nr:glycosyltransferase [Inhella proteolytica]MBH9578013.1 glycosyltransferase [Inhella proteolytica]